MKLGLGAGCPSSPNLTMNEKLSRSEISCSLAVNNAEGVSDSATVLRPLLFSLTYPLSNYYSEHAHAVL